ncbi:Smr/MutS family protein [Halobacteriovorax sp. GB3]|uniref:endonuclease MutS2 n=1 Tax=Halobacteriovorax sp. GB3 TaxID=2719615 RepID=UPI00235DFB3E|nr:Smr/MutS family protein [Halobacteriovorax sp. GB3]MDD0854622.1 Smr/MutS family protein [Halobacteriovorax sp. GB3]
MSHNLLNNSEFLDLVDWPEVANNISTYSHFDFTKEQLLKQLKAKSKSEILQNFDNIDFFIKNFEQFTIGKENFLTYIPSNLESNFSSIVTKSAELTIRQINSLCLAYELYGSLYKTLIDWENFQEFEIGQSEKDKIRNKFVKPLRIFVSKEGHQDLEKHPLLRELFQNLRALEEHLRFRSTELIRDQRYSKIIQFEQFDIVSDRFVIAVRSDSYKSDLGSIVGRSTTGHTLYIEPPELRSANNSKIEITSKIESALSKICRDFTQTIQSFLPEFLKLIDFFKLYDEIYMKSLYSLNAGLNRPEIIDEFSISIEGLFHPLIKNAVKNDIALESNKLGLVISGPNTGGKTVTLKSVIITHLFMHLGIFVPAKRAKLYPVQELYFYSHDQQDLSQGLSSFASEAKNYLELLSTIGTNSLIVIDEIFNSTSSEEASALAISLLEKIHQKSHSKVVLSTHHQLFKTHIHSDNQYVSAYVGYDMEEHAPTYKIFLGEPGSSMALTIFDDLSKRFGVETNISEKAQLVLDRKQVSYEKLLEELSKKKSRLDKLLMENETLNKDLKNKRKSLEGIVHLEKERIINKYEKKVKKIVSQAEDLKRRAKRGEFNIGKRFDKDSHGLVHSVATMKEDLYHKNEQPQPATTTLNLEALASGDVIYSTILKKNVEIISINLRKKEVQIKNGTLKAWMPAKSFKGLKDKHIKKVQPEVTVHVQKTTVGNIEIDCRGMRLEEFQRKAETSINEVISGDIPFLTIIHGHGSGILKKWLREYLSKHRELYFENLDGNDGCTRVYPKE